MILAKFKALLFSLPSPLPPLCTPRQGGIQKIRSDLESTTPKNLILFTSHDDIGQVLKGPFDQYPSRGHMLYFYNDNWLLGVSTSKYMPPKRYSKKVKKFWGYYGSKFPGKCSFATRVSSKFLDFFGISFLEHIFERRDPHQSIVIVKS